MGVNKVTNAAPAYDNKAAVKESVQRDKSELKKQSSDYSDTAAVYEKNDGKTVEKSYKKDSATIDRLLAEADKRAQSLRELVEKMLLKQGQTFNDSTDIYALLREGKVQVDPETQAQAQKDISEDGYWGVSQTADRLVSFAKALTGGDPSKANDMIDAVKRGFEQAKKAWGGDLPDICKKTLDAAINKLEQWRDSVNDDDQMEGAAQESFKDQAAAAKQAE
jgi:ABC-type transporter Mla subunit MlaD